MTKTYEIGKIAHLVSHQVSRDLLKETFCTKVSLSKQVSYKTWRKRTKSVKSHISFLSEVSWDVLKETFCRKVSFRRPKLLKKVFFNSLLKLQITLKVSLRPKSHQISLLSHVITVSTNQNALNLQILWENQRFHPKIFPFK